MILSGDVDSNAIKRMFWECDYEDSYNVFGLFVICWMEDGLYILVCVVGLMLLGEGKFMGLGVKLLL